MLKIVNSHIPKGFFCRLKFGTHLNDMTPLFRMGF